MHAVDQSFIFREGSNEGPFVAFGDVVCSERYILWHAHICNRMFRRIPVNCTRGYQFSHMTLAKLEGGYAERLANKSIWFVDGEAGPEEFDVSTVLRQLNNKLRRDNIVYRLHAVRLSPNHFWNRYAITGGSARDVLRKVQCELRGHLVHLRDHISFWAEEPAHPHITVGYLDDNVGDKCVLEACAAGEVAKSGSEIVSLDCSLSESLEIVLAMLDEHRLSHLKAIFKRERLSSSILPSVTDVQLKDVGVKRLGDRQKVLQLATRYVQLSTMD